MSRERRIADNSTADYGAFRALGGVDSWIWSLGCSLLSSSREEEPEKGSLTVEGLRVWSLEGLGFRV